MTTTRVLIVDDDALVRENLIAYLEDEGMQVDAVPSGEDAVALLRTEAIFDVCIMDMRLPGIDGNDGIRAIHAIAPRMGFIIHTGSADYSPPADLQAMGLGPGQIFHKPLQDMAPLAGRVRDLARATATNRRPPGEDGDSTPV